MNRIFAFLSAFLLWSTLAFAGNGTIPITPGTGATSTATVATSGTTFFPITALCDQSGNCILFTNGTMPVSATIAGTVVTSGSTYVSNATPLGPTSATSSNPVTPSNQPVGLATLATSQVTLSTITATQLVAARTGVSGTGRAFLTVVNDSTNPVWLGNTGVTSSNGVELPGIVGASATFDFTGALYATVSTTPTTLSYFETY